MSDVLGWICVKDYLIKTGGKVIGQVTGDGRTRAFSSEYVVRMLENDKIEIKRANNTGDSIILEFNIPVNRELIAFFGLYAGDGAKGSEDPAKLGRVKVNISFSQREPNLVRFMVEQFREFFSNQIRITFSLGEDSAFFMAGPGLEELGNRYEGGLPSTVPLNEIRPALNSADKRYLEESRNVEGSNEEYLSFYYQHKDMMKKILIDQKTAEVKDTGIMLNTNDKITASLRRPFKKGAREPGGSSRADELHIGGLNGLGELFLKIMYEMESSIRTNSIESPQGLVKWRESPNTLGERIELIDFYTNNPYGALNDERPSLKIQGTDLIGRWPRSIERYLKKSIVIDPLFSYASGLYLAEGATSKKKFFTMYSRPTKGFAVQFTSSEDEDIMIFLGAMSYLFLEEDIMQAWKIKVGSQYFPELVVIGLKKGVPMLRGGKSGDGKLRTMEIALAIKDWALDTFPSIRPYHDLYSHLEPTGAGIARIHIRASSSLAKWLFPVMMYTVFKNSTQDPKRGFLLD